MSFRLSGSLLLVLLSVSFLPMSTHAGRIAELVEADPVPVTIHGKGVPGDDQLLEIVRRAGERRGWHVDRLETGEFVAELHVRSHMISVTLEVCRRLLHFSYRDSKNMNYEKETVDWSVYEPYGGEKQYIHPSYMSWTRNFAQDIQQELQREAGS